MSMIETLSDENNSFLSRREIVCDFNRLGGKLKKLEAVEQVTIELKYDGKIDYRKYTESTKSKTKTRK